MKNYTKITKKIAIFSFILGAIFTLSFSGSFVDQAKASTIPTLSLSNAGGNSVTVNVNGDATASVQLYYLNIANNSSVQSLGVIGTTNANGFFSTVLSGSTYNIPGGASTYVVVDGLQSVSIPWPYYNGTSGGTLSLSQNSITLIPGQSGTITAYNTSYNIGTIYVSSNSNSSVAYASVVNNQINITGGAVGNATIVVCSNGNSSCANIYVVVQNSSSQGQIYFSQNNVTLNVGQTNYVTISGGANNYYYISQNSSLVQGTITGSSLSLYGNSIGNASIVVCSNTGTSACGTLYVTVTNQSGGGVCGVNYFPNGCNNNNGYNNYNNYYPYNGSYYNYNGNNNGYNNTYNNGYNGGYTYNNGYNYNGGNNYSTGGGWQLMSSTDNTTNSGGYTYQPQNNYQPSNYQTSSYQPMYQQPYQQSNYQPSFPQVINQNNNSSSDFRSIMNILPAFSWR